MVSDHGFQPFRRQVHINNWLLLEGYLVAKEGFDKEAASDLSFIDWTHTRVYAIGLGNLYVNLEGREPHGIVPQERVRPLLEELRAKLLEATDPETGERFCKHAYLVVDIHEGPHIGLEGDVILGLKGSYRISWPSTMGGLWTVPQGDTNVIGPVCSDNESNWSGDHVSMALEDVAGVFFSNRALAPGQDEVRLLQIAPTVLTELGVPVPNVMDLGPVGLAR
jgi:predicted AlkP superfamily phosphohydrolase/phosphomutase